MSTPSGSTRLTEKEKKEESDRDKEKESTLRHDVGLSSCDPYRAHALKSLSQWPHSHKRIYISDDKQAVRECFSWIAVPVWCFCCKSHTNTAASLP